MLVVAAAAGLAAVEWFRAPGPAPTPGAPAATAPVAGHPTAAGLAPPFDCPPHHLPDDQVCIPVPPPDEPQAAVSATIDLLPGRSPDYGRYVTPIAHYPAAAASDALGLFIAAPRGVPVTALSLEAQSGPTRRWVTATTPPRLLTLHRVERSATLRTYVLAYEGVAFDTPPGLTEVAVGTPLGRVAARPGNTGLALRVRQVRRGVEPENLAPERLLLDASSLACDPRNVLPLEPSR